MAKSAGIGAISLVTPLSDKMIILASFSTAFSASVRIVSKAISRPFIPFSIGYSIEIETALKSGWLIFFILSRSSFDITGFCILNFLACCGMISKIFLSPPIAKLMSVIISSRIPSNGGLVT